MAKRSLGVFEPVFNGKHISDMTDAELDEFSAWIVEQVQGNIGNDSQSIA